MRNEIIYPELDLNKEMQKPEAPSWLISNIADLSRQASTLHTIFILFLVYCGLTILGTTDRRIILEEQARLPIVDLTVSYTAFVSVAPLIALSLFLYFQLHLQGLKRLINNLRINYAATEMSKIYPWLIVSTTEDSGGIGLLHKLIAAISLWLLLPLVLLLICLSSLKKHSLIQSYYSCSVSLIGILLVSWLWFRYTSSESNATAKHRILQVLHIITRYRIASIFMLLMLLMNLSVLFGVPLIHQGHFRFLNINLSNQILVEKYDEEYPLYWLNLPNIHLEGADLSYTFIKRANFENAYMQRARLNNSYLENSSFVDANLEEASFMKADLRGSNFSQTNLTGTSFADSNLQNAIFMPASCKGTVFAGADLSGAGLILLCDHLNFRKANLRKVKFSVFGSRMRGADFTEADLTETEFIRIDFSNANFKDAKLQGATFALTNFSNANFEGADLQEAKFFDCVLTAQQLSKAKSLYGAALPEGLYNELKQTQPHLFEKPEEPSQ